MKVFLNGAMVNAMEANVSVLDRGFLYGDSVFETLRTYGGKPFYWRAHWKRLVAGAAALRIKIPNSEDVFLKAIDSMVFANSMEESVLRITVSRGVGTRGYSPKDANRPTVVITQHPVPLIDPANPPSWSVITSKVRLDEHDPLHTFKTGNKLLQILARAEADDKGADESLLLNHRGEMVEGSSSTVFWFEGNTVCTPPINAGALQGITRNIVSQIAPPAGLEWRESTGTPETLHSSEGVFLGQSVWELVGVSNLDGKPLPSNTKLASLQEAYRQLTRS
ncbi:MAG TPA: aminotransferase class IV [Roseimicrobium sp.]|nr:aminotransferase class IV [Roseimicrobium sp.]